MAPDEDDADQVPSTVLLMLNSWQATLMAGLITLVFGVIVTAHPDDSMNVLAILIGIVAILSGIFHLTRTLDRSADHRLWLGITGVVFIAIGLILLRHLHLSLAVIALLVGLSWIVQGTAAVMSSFTRSREGALWWGVFGFVSLIAGVVVVAAPEASLTVLAVLVGIWLLVIGLLEIVAGLILQQAAAKAESEGRAPTSWSADTGC